jgi:NAD(P)-dependent dehydrogenase (short-subunit alcohol dehydrogenase family)
MPNLPRYEYTGPVDHTVVPDTKQMKNKSVIVTGGANGIGEACVRAYVKAGAFVTFADMAEAKGKELEAELNGPQGKTGDALEGERVAFIKCDIRDWDQQIAMFETARTRSPEKSVDVVVANAGISRSSGDSLWNLDGERSFPPLCSFMVADMRCTSQTPTARQPSQT